MIMRFDPEFNEDDLLSDLAELRKQGGLKGGQRFAKLVGDEVVECSLSEWVKLLEGRKGVIKQETVGDRYWVSTVFIDRKSTRLNSSHESVSRMPSSA